MVQIGVEYRTAERHNGKPVYMQLVQFGALEAETMKTVIHSSFSGLDWPSLQFRCFNGHVLDVWFSMPGNRDIPLAASYQYYIETEVGAFICIYTQPRQPPTKPCFAEINEGDCPNRLSFV